MDLHGGNIYIFSKEKQKQILDYSSNINPFGVPKKFEELAKKNFDILTAYPDINYTELREKIALHNKVKKENVIVGNGATEILFLYVKAVKPKKVLLVAPCFAEYKRALDTLECEMEYFQIDEQETNFKLDVEKFLEKIKNNFYDLVLLCNPNNPTGNLINLKDIKKISELTEQKKIKFFIDEAFIDFVENWQEKTAILLKSKNIFVMRAFTKFFAVPGLRLGYGLSFDKEILEKMNEIKEPWSVNSFANLAGLSMIDDEEYIKKTEQWIREEKEFFYKELCKFQNIKAYKTEVNFILVKLFNISSENLREKMIEKNILIRDASNFKFLDKSFIRLAIKDRKSNLRVLETLKNILGATAS